MRRNTIPILSVFFLLAYTAAAAQTRPVPFDCTYETQVWNIHRKATVETEKVRHPYGEMRPEEIDQASGCTVCSEDQVLLDLPPLRPFSVCYKLAPTISRVLSRLIHNGAPIHAVVGYHVIKSRGPSDGSGNRTIFSNHSFGTAIDINPEQNGLYDNCIVFGPECRLLRGGEWRSGDTGTLEPDGDVVIELKEAGLHWGGEIEGRQKDFMHFSLSGY